MEWKWVKGYEGLYKVSSLGDIMSMPKEWVCGVASVRKHDGMIMKTCLSNSGYKRVILNNGKGKRLSIHRIVAEAFIDNPLKKAEVNHKNGIKTDNRVENLEWMSRKENTCHAYGKGLIKFVKPPIHKGESNYKAKLTQIKVDEMRKLYKTGVVQTELAKMYGVSQSTVSSVILNQTWA